MNRLGISLSITNMRRNPVVNPSPGPSATVFKFSNGNKIKFSNGNNVKTSPQPS